LIRCRSVWSTAVIPSSRLVGKISNLSRHVFDLTVDDESIAILSPTTRQTVPGWLARIAEGLLVNVTPGTLERRSATRGVDGDLDGRDGAAAAEPNADLGRGAAAGQRPCRGAGAIAGGGGRGWEGSSDVACLVGVGGVVAGDEVEEPGWVSGWWQPAGGGGDSFYVGGKDIVARA
jgi:hypothetical protein